MQQRSKRRLNHEETTFKRGVGGRDGLGGGREMDEMIKRVMDICVDALRCEDLEVYGYSESYQRFTVKTSKGDIRIDFDEED